MQKYSDSIEARFTARHAKCIEISKPIDGARVLDIGCYNGWYENQAVTQASLVVGVDVRVDVVRRAKRAVPSARFVVATARDLPFRAESFDLVTMFDVIEHIPSDSEVATLDVIRNVLRGNGRLMLSTPNQSFLGNLLDPAWYFGHRHYSSELLSQIAQRAGFEVVDIQRGGAVFEFLSMILLYVFKWLLNREIPFKAWFDKRRYDEYFSGYGFATLFVVARNKGG